MQACPIRLLLLGRSVHWPPDAVWKSKMGSTGSSIPGRSSRASPSRCPGHRASERLASGVPAGASRQPEAIASTEHLRREAKDNKAARIEAEGRAAKLFDRVKELEAKLEMAEVNLRTVLAAARGRGATAAHTDNEME